MTHIHTYLVQVKLKQLEGDIHWQVLARDPCSSPASDADALRDYFNLHEPLAEMSKDWAKKDPRFKLISPYFPGRKFDAVLKVALMSSRSKPQTSPFLSQAKAVLQIA